MTNPVPYPDAEAHGVDFFERQLAATILAEAHALTLCDILEDPVADVDGSGLLKPGRSMAVEVRARAEEDLHHSERWSVHFATLARLCESWHPAQAFAVVDAIDRYWSSGLDDALSAVGLVRRPANSAPVPAQPQALGTT